VVVAPNLGTFYRAPKPGAAPFLEIGQKVSADTEVCLIEVMKLFTSVKAGVAGTVRHVAVADAELVEGGQPLLYIAKE
jgi:biotin carboxyl carrier protein